MEEKMKVFFFFFCVHLWPRSPEIQLWKWRRISEHWLISTTSKRITIKRGTNGFYREAAVTWAQSVDSTVDENSFLHSAKFSHQSAKSSSIIASRCLMACDWFLQDLHGYSQRWQAKAITAFDILSILFCFPQYFIIFHYNLLRQEWSQTV